MNANNAILRQKNASVPNRTGSYLRPLGIKTNGNRCPFLDITDDIGEGVEFGMGEIDSEKRIAKVIEVLCQGCGACAAICPNAATKQVGFAKEDVMAAVDSLT